MLTYKRCQELYSQAKNKDNGKPIQRNTRIIKTEYNEYAVKLHQTNVLTFKKNGNIVLNSGGWNTPTTKDRIVTYGPRLLSMNGTWIYLYNNKRYQFFDGMELNKKGKPINQKPLTEKDEKSNLKFRKKVNNYINKFCKAIDKGEIGYPDAGDCWDCCLRTSEGSPLGELHSDSTHLISHINELYFVPSLLFNAIKYTEDKVIFKFNETAESIYHKIIQLRLGYFAKRFLRKYMFGKLKKGDMA